MSQQRGRGRGQTRRGARYVGLLLGMIVGACQTESDASRSRRISAPVASSPAQQRDSGSAHVAVDPSDRDPEPSSWLVAPGQWGQDVQDGGRRLTRLRLRPRWSYIASDDDTTILHPLQAEVIGQSVIVQDIGRVSLVALHGADGSPLWSKGRRGSGPEEFQSGYLIQEPERTLYFYDLGLRRLSEWSESGELLASRQLSSMGSIRGLCRTKDNRLIASVSSSGTQQFVGVAELLPDVDTLTDRRPLPFDRPIHRTGLDAQMRLFALGGGSCALAALSESLFFLFDDVDSMQRMPLIEHVPAPTLVETKEGKATRVSFRGVLHNLSARDSTFVIVTEDTTGFGRVDVFTIRDTRMP